MVFPAHITQNTQDNIISTPYPSILIFSVKRRLKFRDVC